MRYAAHIARQLTRPRRHPFSHVYTPRSVTHQIHHRRSLLTLAIETSCDDTCVAILESHRNSTIAHNSHNDPATPPRPQATLHFDEKITTKNSGIGGIHPLEALDSHRTSLAKLVDTALLSLPRSQGTDHSKHVSCRDGSVRRKPDCISVTRGPGMRNNLLVGLELAKGLAVAWQVPLVGVHHMQAHALTPRFVSAMQRTDAGSEHQPDFPFLTLLVSGGHTMLLYSTGLTEHEILLTTTDVAIGDALDRTGWMLLPEENKAKAVDAAFGKYLSEYAFSDQQSFAAWPVAKRRTDEMHKPKNQFGWQMQAPLSDTRSMVFSFGSIESRVAGILKEREVALQGPLSPEERILLAQSAIGTAFEHLGSRTVIALEHLQKQGVFIQNLVVSGGVAANRFLRYYLQALLSARGFGDIGLVFPPVRYCTDNAAMIGWAGLEMYEAGYSSELSIGALRKWSMDTNAADGGIIGVGGWRDHTTQQEQQTSMLNVVSGIA